MIWEQYSDQKGIRNELMNAADNNPDFLWNTVRPQNLVFRV
jgi:hypothetical protein